MIFTEPIPQGSESLELEMLEQHVLLKYFMDFFLIFHWVIHFAFKNKPQNNFRNLYLSILINTMGFCSLVYIILLLIH